MAPRGEMAEEAARFGERIRKQLGFPVEMVDERLTSWEAERLLEEQSGKVFHDDATTAHQKRSDSSASLRRCLGRRGDFKGISGATQMPAKSI